MKRSILMTVVVLSAGCQSMPAPVAKTGDYLSNLVRKPGNDAARATPILPSPEIGPHQKADVQMAWARLMEKDQQNGQAVQMYEDVLKKDPKKADALHRLAVLHDKEARYGVSQTYYTQALNLDKDNAELHCDLGYSFYLQGRFREAEDSLARAIALNGNLKRAHNNLGLVMARTARYDQALKHFARAGCSEAEARANLVHSLLLDKNWQEAERQCELAMAAGHGSPEVTARLDQFRSHLASVKNSTPRG